MNDSVSKIPPEYGSVTPYLVVKGVDRLITFLVDAFGAEERMRGLNDDGTVGHAEVLIGDSVVQMFDARPDWPETPGFLTLYVENCDETHASALRAGAREITPLSTNPWGDRGSRIRDPLGNLWWVLTHIADPSEEEMAVGMGGRSFAEDSEVSSRTLDEAMRRIGSPKPPR
ncbi:MAG: VOC family protein [Dermatophilaceae bacterium]